MTEMQHSGPFYLLLHIGCRPRHIVPSLTAVFIMIGDVLNCSEHLVQPKRVGLRFLQCLVVSVHVAFS
jgi:hypothetical protein